MAGIAAATVAVTATFGVAVGVLGTAAAFAGITASSITAGAAGCAGIGLIATSALIAPKHAEVPADDIKEEVTADDIKEEEVPAPEIKKETVDIKKIDFTSSVAKTMFDMMLSKLIDTKTGRLNAEYINKRARTLYIGYFVKNVLQKAQIQTDKVSDESVATVKQAINQCIKKIIDNNDINKNDAEIFNKKEFKTELLNELKNDDDISIDNKILIDIFIKAISSDNDDNNISNQSMIEA